MDQLALSDRTVDLDSGVVSTGDQLRPMELRVLRYLAARGGATVTVDELLGGVWRYATGVRTRTVHSTLYRLRRAIEAEPGRPSHLVTVPGAGVRLLSTVRTAPTPTNLVPARDPFIGRTAELGVSESEAPLVSVVGPSGVGKTRLVTEWASSDLRRFGGGAWFVDAAGARSVTGLTDRIASLLRCERRELRDVLAATHGAVLLIVDDLPPDLPEWTAAIDSLVGLGGWTLVVTSHAPLGIAGEQRIRLGPLAYGTGLEDPSVGLLLARIREDDPLFCAEDHAVALVELARTLEGSPLALELAAPHAALLGPARALEALRASGRLATRRHDRPHHHRSTEAMVEHTWSLLPPEARRALLQLSVFDRTFSLELAVRLLEREPGVTSGSDLLSDLVSRGLVTQVGDRFRLYDLVRAFVRTQDLDPELPRRVIARYAELAASVLEDGLLTDVPLLGDEELTEWEAVAAQALRDPDPDPGRCAIAVYAGIAAIVAERMTLIASMATRLERVALPAVCRARFRAARAMFDPQLQPYPQGLDAAEQVARELEELGLPVAEARLRFDLAITWRIAGRLDAAVRAYARGRAVLATLPAHSAGRGQLELLANHADCTRPWGQPTVDRHERTLSLLSDLGVPERNWAVMNLASAQFEAGFVDQAEATLSPLLTSKVGRTTARRSLALWGAVLARHGRGREALRIVDEAVSLSRRGQRWGPMLEVLLRSIDVRLEVGDLAGVEQDLEHIVERTASGRTPRAEFEIAFGRAKIEACRGGPLQPLADVTERARELGLCWWQPLEWLARARVAREDHDRALAALDTLPPGGALLPEPVRIRIEALRGLGRPGEAARLLSRLSPAMGGFGWLPQACAAALWEAGQEAPDPGPIDDREPWSRVWLARIAVCRGAPTTAGSLIQGCTHTTRPLLLVRAIEELRSLGSAVRGR